MKLKNTIKHKILIITPFVPVFLMVLFAVMVPELSPSDSSAATGTVSANIQGIDYVLSITASDLAINVESTPAGAFSFGKNTVTVQTTSTSGYELYLSMNTDDVNGNRLFRNNAGVIDTTNYIEATTVQSGTPDMDSWGFSTDYNSTAGTGTWSPVPLKASPVLVGEDDTINPLSGAVTTTNDVYFGVKADTAMADGEYKNTILYTAIANAGRDATPTILVNGNEITNETIVKFDDTLAISTPIITTVEIPSSDISVTVGGVSCANISADQTNGNLVVSCSTPSLLQGTHDIAISIARFGKNYTIANAITYGLSFFDTGVAYMQDMTPEICNSVYTPSNATGNNITIITDPAIYASTVTANNQPYVPQRTLIDVRGKDGTGTMENPATGANEQTYIVRKLADGNCWMVQNLNMNLSSSVTLTNGTTDIGYGEDSNNQTTGRSSWTPNANTQTSTYRWYASSSYSYEPGDKWSIGLNDSTTTRPSDETEAGTRHFGNIYNWNAATAGSAFSGSSPRYTSSGQYAADSICPKGWRLPLGPTSTSEVKSFGNILNIYGDQSADIFANPIALIYSGYYYGEGPYYAGSGTDGMFWTSEGQSSTSATMAAIQSGFRVSSSAQSNGNSIRCVNR